VSPELIGDLAQGEAATMEVLNLVTFVLAQMDVAHAVRLGGEALRLAHLSHFSGVGAPLQK